MRTPRAYPLHAILSVALPVAACGGAALDVSAPGEEAVAGAEDAADAGEVLITDDAPDVEETAPAEPEKPAPGAGTAAGPETAGEVADPSRGSATEDPLCRRHYRELMVPPAAARPPIDCDRVDRIAYWRWTVADGARSIAHLRLERDGAMVVEHSGGGAGDAGGASAPLKRSIDPAAAAAAVRKTCEAFNREYDPGEGIGCPAGSRLVEFFEGDAKSGRTEALPCDSRAMSAALADLDRMLDRR